MTPNLIHLKITHLIFNILRTATNKYHTLISLAKRTYNSNLIIFSNHRLPLLTSSTVCYILLKQSFQSPHQPSLHHLRHSCSFSPHIYPSRYPHLRTCLSKWNSTLISQCSNSCCDIKDQSYTYLTCYENFIFNWSNYSLQRQSFTYYWILSTQLKSSFVASLLKKPFLDKDII